MRPEIYFAVVIFVCMAAIAASAIYHSKVMRPAILAEVQPKLTAEQMQVHEAKISKFLASNNIEPGSSIGMIGAALNILIGETGAAIPKLAQLNYPAENGMMTVSFQTELSLSDWTLPFAHECAHILNGDSVAVVRGDVKVGPGVEDAADYTAGALLMPLETVYTFLERHDFQGASKSRRVNLVKKLCAQYGVEPAVALRRIREIYTLKAS